MSVADYTLSKKRTPKDFFFFANKVTFVHPHSNLEPFKSECQRIVDYGEITKIPCSPSYF